MPYVVGESVHVPASKLGVGDEYPFSMASTKVREVTDRSVKVDLRDGSLSEDISLSVVRKKLGILIIEIGDYKTEETLLAPLKKSILQFTRLLLSDDYIKNYTIRTPGELKHIWTALHAVTSHLILIGHGDSQSLLFGEDTTVKAGDLIQILSTENGIGEAKQVISLCCKTGSKTFGGSVSGNPNIESFIGPVGSVHGATASQFCQSYLTYLFLQGYRSSTAYEYAKAANPGTSDFVFWRKTQAFASKSGTLRIAREQPNG
ncbi:hypothetical protein [Xanthomonas sp. SHU 199]|uniref:hypothetical protein n=1 Tax=Xanthomonas sp. SHU 199 TaxID=1591174 RepID=UPI0012FEEE3B|nr:hypothetical protein [Xanthomonas sp. SHU 199]